MSLSEKTIVIPAFDEPSNGYSEQQSEALVGRGFVRKAGGGLMIGEISDTYSYRYENEEKIHYGLHMIYKFVDGWALRDGSLERWQLEKATDGCLLRGFFEEEVLNHLIDHEMTPPAMVKALEKALDRGTWLRRNLGKGFSF